MDVEESRPQGPKKQNNVLPLWGNEKTMNLNSMILTNVLSSPYFKNELFQLKTYHEVVDEIYYKVDHLEPWEKGSRKTAGQVGMCGGVRGVGAGGIVSTAFCLLYKLFTLKLTRKQLNGLITHVDSPYIRALGFMFIRYCQPPNKLWEWMEPYLEDEEEVDPKAGGGCTMTIGQMVRSFLLKLEWYGTLFPRIPVPVQKDLETKLRSKGLCDDHKRTAQEGWGEAEDFVKRTRDESPSSRRHGEAADGDRHPKPRRSRSRSRDRDRDRDRDRGREKRRSRSPDRDSSRRRSKERRSHERRRDDSRDRDKRRKRSRSRSPNRRSRDDDRKRRSRSRDRNRERRRSSDRDESRGRSNRDKKENREKDRSRSR
ncbi:pre-mRNA-splicing factor 38B-like [Orbicella faveolata]|uniref:pre-mRNA-splicing factor 38B-like n=1 Tax=Orbicella faveolata TaxID=48498 RepID=UPI0009E4FE71|nr:pre-mRNA-splicing factor 38B-like [Orbicella faveolata]